MAEVVASVILAGKTIYHALQNDDIDKIKSMLDEGLDPNLRLSMHSPLAMAVGLGHLEACELLLDRGADVNVGGRSGAFPLCVAARERGDDNLDVLRLLLARGADVNLIYVNGNSALLEAVYHAKTGEGQKVLELIGAGSDVHLTNNGGDSALHMAAAKGNMKLLKMFLGAGVKPDALKRSDRGRKRIVSSSGIRPLHLAAFGPNGGHPHVAHALLEAGADVDAAMANGRTTLHVCAMRNARRVADVLLSNGCAIDPISVENEEHKTPLFKAVDGGHLAMVERLIAAGADLNTRDVWGLTPLITAAFKGDRQVATALVQAGCDCDLAGNTGLTALVAALSHDPMVAKMLIHAGCRLPLPVRDGILDRSVWSPRLEQDPDLAAWIVARFENPAPLHDLCRMSIRHRISPRPRSRIQRLPLPGKVLEYLLLDSGCD